MRSIRHLARSRIFAAWSPLPPNTAWKSRSISPSSARSIIPGSSSIREWFRRRADGTIRYAENPPKKYEDIVNVDFYAEGAVPDLWLALRDIVLHLV